MKRHYVGDKQRWRISVGFWVTAATVLYFGLLAVGSASASYEQVGNFAGTPGDLREFHASWPEQVQLGGVGGMAVNYTGAGGVPAGTIYATTLGDPETHWVARYNPDGSFSEAWSTDGSPPVVRCGPEGDPARPVCESRPEKDAAHTDVEVDQTTGYVYVLGSTFFKTGTPLIRVYTPDGSKVVAEFGVAAPEGQTIAESPEKLHEARRGGLAVTAAGDVYVFDMTNPQENHRHRIMSFEPSTPGDYEHYVYTGEAHDFDTGNESGILEQPITDLAGNVYVAGEKHVVEFASGSLGAAPVCDFSVPIGGVVSITVNPENGEVFFFDYKDNKIHQLRPCKEGKFVEVGTSSLSPPRIEEVTLAIDPVRSFAAGRPPGVLFAASASGRGGKEAAGGLHESAIGFIFARPPEVSPVVESELASHVTSSSAVLGARINPEGSVTRFAFQYVTQTQYEENEAGEPFTAATEIPLGGGPAGEEKKVVAVSASAGALAPDASYRYRVVATSNCSVDDPEKVCETIGETRSFRTYEPQTASVLPDARVYELVSPVLKAGGQVFPADPSIGSCEGCKPGAGGHYPQLSATDGDAVVYRGLPFSSEEGSVGVDEYIARRNPTSGWQTANITPSMLEGPTGVVVYRTFSNDLRHGLIEQGAIPTSGEEPGEYANFDSQPSEDPSALTPFLTTVPPNRSTAGSNEFKVVYAGASADLSRVFFEANDALTEEVAGVAPAAVDGGEAKFNLYEWTGGRLSLVNVMPGNTATQPGGSFGAHANGSENGASNAHAVSDDGSRVFFSVESGQVYVREDGQITREIETEGVPDPGHFVAAAADGSAVLLANGHLHYLGGDGSMLDLTQGQGGFQGLVGQGEDLSHIYFVDTQVLTGEEENKHCTSIAGKSVCEKATESADNLYAWTQNDGTRFIGTLNGTDNIGVGLSPLDPVQDWSVLPATRTAQASPSGRYLAFLSAASLTGYDNTGPCETDHNGGYVNSSCPEVFVYDSVTDRLRCASCKSNGASPLGWSVLRRILGQSSLPLAHYLTDEGRLFFDSEDSLVPADTNGDVEDVYEYEPEGVGSCQGEGGCVSLISTGTGSFDSNVLGVDGDGANVFFTTLDRLSPRDKDEVIDLYDARADGGLAVETVTASTECHGEICQPPVSLLSGASTPSSESFEGAGNLKEVTATPLVKHAAHKKVKHKKAKHKKPKPKKRPRHKAKRGGIHSVKHNHGSAK